MAHPFDHPSFKVASLTEAMNLLPVNHGDSRALFSRMKRVTTRTILVEEKNGVLTLIKSQDLGSEGKPAGRGKRKVRSFVIPHFPLPDVILPDEYQDLRGFGKSALAARSDLVKDRLWNLKASHTLTHEFLRMGAKKGLILDADGSVLYDLYAEFGITKKVVHFELDKDTTDVAAKCREVLRHVEDNLRGDSMKQVHLDVDEKFFDALISHKSVKEVFLGHQAAVQKLGGDERKGFRFGGLLFSEHRGKHVDEEGEVTNFVNENKGHAYPEGTQQSFFTACAPADFNETANTLGKEFYAKMEPRKFGRGMDIHTQSNVLPMCCRPGVLVECDAGSPA
ncbi:TPA: major capsid protein [Vibrio parahaemolyticus]|nr:major capsid protein [Vibrio parahaemolyticus]